MKTNIRELEAYMKDLIEQDGKVEKKLGRFELEIILHTKSEKINASSMEIKMDVYENDKSQFPLSTLHTTLIVVDKSSISKKSGVEYIRTCSIVMDSNKNEIVWDKLAKDSSNAAVEFMVGYLIINSLIIRNRRPVSNISEYVRRLVTGLNTAETVEEPSEVTPEEQNG